MSKKNQEIIENEREQKENLAFKVSSFAHDIKTPLTVLQGNLELLMYSSLNKEQKQFIMDTIYASEQMKNYFNEFIKYSKTFYENEMEFENYFVSDLVKIICDEVRFIIKDKSELVIINNVSEDRTIKINLHYLIRAILNIMSNSLEYSKVENKKIQIEIEEIHNKLSFRIWNNGPPFSSDVLGDYKDVFKKKIKIIV